MHYREEDLLRLVGSVPFMRLMHPEGATRVLRRAADDAEELASMLRQYPQVRYEPLDFHYVCLLNLGALSQELIEDLTCHFGWRGLVWASLLAALAPSEAYREALEAACAREPRQAWAVDLALARLGGFRPAEVEELLQLIERLDVALSTCPLPKVTLRPAESPAAIDARRAVVAAAYRRAGKASPGRGGGVFCSFRRWMAGRFGLTKPRP